MRAGALSVSGWQTSSLSMRAIDVDNLVSPRTESVSESRIRTEQDGMDHISGIHSPNPPICPPCSCIIVRYCQTSNQKSVRFPLYWFKQSCLKIFARILWRKTKEGVFYVFFSTSPCNKTLRVHNVFAATVHSSGHPKRLLGSHAKVTTVVVAQTKTSTQPLAEK